MPGGVFFPRLAVELSDFAFFVFLSNLPTRAHPSVAEVCYKQEKDRWRARRVAGSTSDRPQREPSQPNLKKITIGWVFLAFGAGSAAVLQTAASHRALVL